MSRRDTIIIAVLINAGLLIVLFASALKSNSSGSEVAAATFSEPEKVAELPVKIDAPAAPAEEVDQVLRQHAAFAAAPQTAAPVLPEAKPNFAEDLQAIALPENTVAAAFPQPTDTAPRFIEVTVKKGDVLEKIARANQTTVEEIVKLNQLPTTRLKIGQVLKVAQGSKKTPSIASKPAAPKPAAAATDSSPKYYTVKKGDNPWTIAVKNHIKVEELLKLNQLTEEKARHLKPGDQLRIR